MNKETLEIGHKLYYNIVNDGGALIKRTIEGYELYEIPLYGGAERYYKTYNTLQEAKDVANKWT